MKTRPSLLPHLTLLLLLSMLAGRLSTAFAQGTAFTYQGRLNDGANPATGIYDLRFTIYDALTGGGAVVQGPGCLDYALVLPVKSHSALATHTGTNRYVMATLREAIASLLPDSAVRIEGSTDMTVGGRKVAGNAQRRGTTHLLFHGVFLLDLDLRLLEELLPLPSRQPAYRRARPHREFVCNLPLPASAVKRAIAGAWRAVAEPLELPEARIRELLDVRYRLPSWNFRR